jgi:hypothetical protein
MSNVKFGLPNYQRTRFCDRPLLKGYGEIFKRRAVIDRPFYRSISRVFKVRRCRVGRFLGTPLPLVSSPSTGTICPSESTNPPKARRTCRVEFGFSSDAAR